MESLMMSNEMNGRFAEEELGGVRVVEITDESSNARTVKLQFLQRNGREMQKKCAVEGYLSSDEDGNTLEPDSSTLGVSAGTDGLVAPRAADDAVGASTFLVVSEDDGDADVTITQTSGADTIYLNLILPNGQVFNSEAITFAA